MELRASGPLKQQFVEKIGVVAAAIGDRPIDGALAKWLNATFPPHCATYQEIAALIHAGYAEGWLCPHEDANGIRFGRAIKAGREAGTFSVDVAKMDSVVGPPHIHPKGEIGMVVPLAGEPVFDGTLRSGWVVHEPGSLHQPTVEGGSVYVLYMLPDGEIEFTRSDARKM